MGPSEEVSKTAIIIRIVAGLKEALMWYRTRNYLLGRLEAKSTEYLRNLDILLNHINFCFQLVLFISREKFPLWEK